jgi:hypothetical protein
VDDVFIVYKGSEEEVNLFLNHINKVHKTIKFKLEVEKDNIINFLDVKVIKKGSKLEFGVHRKPTQTDLIIPKDSNHPMSYKMASFRSLVYRLLTHNLSHSEFLKEKNTIKQIAINNGYDSNIIDNLIRKTKFKLIHPTEKEKKQFIPFGYVNKYSESIGNIFKQASFYPGYKINKQNVWNKGVKTQAKDNSKGVYLIECDKKAGCEQKYIGYTNRTFKDRFKEHNARNQKNPSSKVAQHLKENPNHFINFENSLHVLKKCNDKVKARIYEEYFIYKYVSENGKDRFLNKKEDFSNKVTYQLYKDLE